MVAAYLSLSLPAALTPPLCRPPPPPHRLYVARLFSNICSNKFNLINGSCWVSGCTMVMMEMLVMMIMFKKIENETFFVLCFIYLANSTISREMNPSCQKYEKRWLWSGLHNSFHPTIRDGSTWSMFGARGKHGDVFLFSNLGALWFLENCASVLEEFDV